MVILTDYFAAVNAFHRTTDPETKHHARVALLKVALNGSGKVAERARQIFADEGVLVIPTQQSIVKHLKCLDRL